MRVAALALVLAGCGAPPVAVYTGAVDQTDARIALVTDGENVVAYSCGGPNALRELTSWYEGPLGEPELAGLVGGKVMTAIIPQPLMLEAVAIGPHSARGVLADRARGVSFAFHASLGGALFDAVESGCRTGVIVDPRLGSQGVWCDAADNVAQVDPGAPREHELDGFEVHVAVASGEAITVEVEPVRPLSD